MDVFLKAIGRILLLIGIGFILFCAISVILFEWSFWEVALAGVVGGAAGLIIWLCTLNSLVEKYYREKDQEEESNFPVF